MSKAKILIHPTLERAPVRNQRRHGPTPRGIPMLNRVRWERSSQERELRWWAASIGLGESWSTEDLRQKKEEYDAIDRIKQGPDRGTWLELQRLARDCLDLAVTCERLHRDLIERNKIERSR